MKINIETIKQVSENINKYNITEAVIETEDVKLTIKKEIPTERVVVTETVRAPKVVETPNYEEIPVVESFDAMESIDSPIVGTFYGAPAPGAAPFVTEGQEVKAGDVLCIVEAMKLMNEVKAAKNCRIEKVLAEEGKVVKKGEKLFIIS